MNRTPTAIPTPTPAFAPVLNVDEVSDDDDAEDAADAAAVGAAEPDEDALGSEVTETVEEAACVTELADELVNDVCVVLAVGAELLARAEEVNTSGAGAWNVSSVGFPHEIAVGSPPQQCQRPLV